MIIKKSVFLFIILIFINSFVPAQNKNYKIIQLPKEQGVATDLVYKMIVDKRGFLWLGTMFGLVKYDGKNYHIYNNDPFDSTTISYDDVINIFEDKDGFIWVLTWANGVNRLNPLNEKFDRFLFRAEDSSSISSNSTTQITQDDSGNIWIASQNGVLNKYIKQNNSFERFEIPKSILRKANKGPHVVSYFSAKENNLIICYGGEVLKFDMKKKRFEQYFAVPDSEFLEDKFVSLLYYDSKNNFWIGTYSGLFKYDSQKKFIKVDFTGDKKIPSHYSNMIRELREDNDNNLWIGTPIGLNKLNEDRKTFSFFTNRNRDGIYIDYDVNSIAFDKGGVMWVSSYRRGLYKIFEDNNIFETVLITTNEPQSQNYTIKILMEDNRGDIYAGSFGRGLLKLNKQLNTFEEVLTGDIIFSNINALAAENNKLWIGSNTGLRLYDFSTQKFLKTNLKVENLKSFENVAIASLVIDTQNRLWAATANKGLFLINKKRTEAKFIDLQSEKKTPPVQQDFLILNINADKNNNIWVGTFGGIYKYSPEKDLTEHFKNDPLNKSSISNNYIFSFNQDNKGFIWIGTANGLNKYDPVKNKFTRYYKKDGLPSAVINGITEDTKGNIWLSTNKGISKFDINLNRFYNFDSNNEITANAIIQNAYLKGSDNKIYFGARGGLIIINPEVSDVSNYNVPVLINSLVFGNNFSNRTKIISPANNIEIKHNENFITINFIALDYKYPGRITYEYKLEGFDNEWIFPGNNNSAIYNNLPPGKYTFLLNAVNENGTRSSETAELNFIVLPPFWKTWWFITMCLIILAAAVYAIYKSAVKIKIKRGVEIELIKINAREELKRKTAVDFHDEVGYRLTKISILSELIKRKLPEPVLSSVPQLIQISEISNEIYNGTKDFIWSIDPQNDTVYELFVRLKDFGDEFFNATKIDFKTEGLGEELKNYYLSSDWKRHLMLIFKEAMNNVLRHSCAGQVILSMCINKNILIIQIEDNGKGFDIIEPCSGSGLNNIKNRAQKINSSIEIKSKPGAGTKIIFTGELIGNAN